MTTHSTLTATHRNVDVPTLQQLLTERRDARADYVVPASQLKANFELLSFETPDGDVTVKPSDQMIGDLANRLDIPVKYLRACYQRAETTQDLDSRILHERSIQGQLRAMLSSVGDRSYLIRTFKPAYPDGLWGGGPSYGRAMLSDRYSLIDDYDVALAVFDGIEQAGHSVVVQGVDVTPRNMRIRIHSPAVNYMATEWLKDYKNPFSPDHTGYQPGTEPIVFAGFEVSNSEVGAGAFTIAPRIWVKICRNGYVIRNDQVREVHLGGRQEAGQIEWSADTQRKAVELVTARTRDAVTTFLSPDYLESTIRQLEDASAKPVPLETATAVIAELASDFAWTEDEQKNLFARFARGGQETAGGIMHAVTALAQETADPHRAADLEWSALDVLAAASS